MTLRLMNLFVCRNKHAHLPHIPQPIGRGAVDPEKTKKTPRPQVLRPEK